MSKELKEFANLLETKVWDESKHPRAPKGSSEGGQWVVVNHGGDRYDGGVSYSIRKGGETVDSGLIDGAHPIEFQGKKYEGLVALSKALNAKLVMDPEAEEEFNPHIIAEMEINNKLIAEWRRANPGKDMTAKDWSYILNKRRLKQ